MEGRGGGERERETIVESVTKKTQRGRIGMREERETEHKEWREGGIEGVETKGASRHTQVQVKDD